ncbi:hypothetical protein BFINE_29880 [Bacteroides finegoldii DSM 17565]|nr:hypothetical protein BFINE_29880 [Bacteroides finegoldii DSM 17565]
MEKADNTTPSSEELAIYMEESIVSVTSAYEQSPVVLMVDDAVIGTLGNFSASIGKAKSKKTFNVSAIVASALRAAPFFIIGLHSQKINGRCYTLTRNKDGIIVRTY